ARVATFRNGPSDTRLPYLLRCAARMEQTGKSTCNHTYVPCSATPRRTFPRQVIFARIQRRLVPSLPGWAKEPRQIFYLTCNLPPVASDWRHFGTCGEKRDRAPKRFNLWHGP